MRAIKCVFLFLVVCLPGLSIALPDAKNHHGGAYLNVGAGLSLLDADSQSHVKIDLHTKNDVLDISQIKLENDQTPLMSLSFGYAFSSPSDLYFSIEGMMTYLNQDQFAHFNLLQQDAEKTNWFADHKLSLKSSGLKYGLLFRPGWFLSEDSLFYGIAGIVFQNFELTADTIYSRVDKADFGSVSASHTKKLLGSRFGVGFEHFISDVLSMRAEYYYDRFSTISLNRSSGIRGVKSQPDDKVFTDVKVRPLSHNIGLSVSYHF